MTYKTFIKKEHPDLPDSYKIKFHYVTGKTEEFEIVSHRLEKESACVEFVTVEDQWHWVSLENLLRVEFDKNLSKIVAYHSQLQSENKDELSHK